MSNNVLGAQRKRTGSVVSKYLPSDEVREISAIYHDKYNPLPSLEFIFLANKESEEKNNCGYHTHQNICKTICTE